MRLILLGSGAFGLPTFKHLHAHHDVCAVISQPDRPAGRKRQLTATPVAQWAADVGLPTFKPDDANAPQTVAQLAAYKADAAVVIAFGQKLSPLLIDALGRLVVNLHASLLPKYRGAAPINWAMIHGEQATGVSVISLAQKMDAGLIYATAQTPIDPLETAGELHDRLAALGPAVVSDVLRAFADGSLRGVPQDERLATRAPKLSKADGHVDFTQDAMGSPGDARQAAGAIAAARQRRAGPVLLHRLQGQRRRTQAGRDHRRAARGRGRWRGAPAGGATARQATNDDRSVHARTPDCGR